MTALLLLLPLLLPLAAAFLARRRAEQRSLIALMGLELALVLLCLFCKGEFSLPFLPGIPILLRLDAVGRIFSVLFAAMFLLAEMYEKGEYVGKDLKKARKLYLMASENGMPEAREEADRLIG